MSLGGVYRHWGRVYVLRECMKVWSIGWGGVFRRSLQALGKGLCVEGVYEGVVYRLGVSLGGVYRHWGRVYVLRECMRAWSIGWGCL